MGQNLENCVKFWKLGKMLKIRQNLKNWAKFWKSGKIFEKPGKISKILMRVKCASYSQLFPGTSTNDARASNPAKNWSHKSARHLQKTRARNLRGDTRGLPEAICSCVIAYASAQLDCYPCADKVSSPSSPFGMFSFYPKAEIVPFAKVLHQVPISVFWLQRLHELQHVQLPQVHRWDWRWFN